MKEHTRTPLKLIIEKIWCRLNRTTIEYILRIFFACIYDDKKRSKFQQKKSKIILSVVESILEHKCECFNNNAMSTRQRDTWPRCEKVSGQLTIQLPSPTQSRKWEMHPFSFFHVWTTFEHQVQDLYASQNFKFYTVFVGQKHISGNNSCNNEQVQKRLHHSHSKNNYCS